VSTVGSEKIVRFVTSEGRGVKFVLVWSSHAGGEETNAKSERQGSGIREGGRGEGNRGAHTSAGPTKTPPMSRNEGQRPVGKVRRRRSNPGKRSSAERKGSGELSKGVVGDADWRGDHDGLPWAREL